MAAMETMANAGPMATWKILLIALLSAVALGSVGGILIGKYLVKRAKSPRPPILTPRERIIYSACLVLGAAFILFGVFFKFPVAQNPGEEAGMPPGGNPGVVEKGEPGGDGGAVVLEEAVEVALG